MVEVAEPLSPKWWLSRLCSALEEQRRKNEIYRQYYCGIFPFPWLNDDAKAEFERLLALTNSNYMGLVVDAQVERQEVVGFRVNTRGDNTGSDKIADDVMWRIWQHSQMDTYSDLALLEAAVTGRAYLMLDPPGRGSSMPQIFVEHPDQMIMEFFPGTNRRVPAAALKMWVDDWTGKTMATMHLWQQHAHWVYKFVSRQAAGSNRPDWVMRELPDERWPARTGMSRIPVWEMPNNPLLLYGGRSEIDDLMAIQDRVNKGLADRLVAQDFGAFPQRWATGWPEYDAAGNATQKVDVGQTRLLGTDAIDARFGSFAATDLEGFISTKLADVRDIASRSRTPAHYLLGDVTNVAGDTLRMAETGLAAKVRQRNRPHSASLESLAPMARVLSGEPALPDTVVVETLWRDPEFRSEGELVDALVKMRTLGVPFEALWERWGATPVEIQRWRQMYEEELRRQAAADPLATLAGRYVQPGDAAPADSPATGARVGARGSQPVSTGSEA